MGHVGSGGGGNTNRLQLFRSPWAVAERRQAVANHHERHALREGRGQAVEGKGVCELAVGMGSSGSRLQPGPLAALTPKTQMAHSGS